MPRPASRPAVTRGTTPRRRAARPPQTDPYYLVPSARSTHRPKAVLNHQEIFAIVDPSGDLSCTRRLDDWGLFYHGTRHLDRLELRVNGDLPLFLTSRIGADNVELATQLTNADVVRDGAVLVARDTIAIRRVKLLADDRLYEVIDLESYHPTPVTTSLTLDLHADFADIFELRGQQRTEHGTLDEPHAGEQAIVFGYHGRDGRRRTTVVRVEVAPVENAARRSAHLRPDGIRLDLVLEPAVPVRVTVVVECTLEGVATAAPLPFDEIRARRHAGERAWLAEHARIHSSNQFLNAWLGQSAVDLAMLRSTRDGASLIYAGVPWFATTFGRDAVIAALETLDFGPAIAAGTLRRLAALQGTVTDAEREEEPGKIIHEMRTDEMAVAGEVPFGRYYGSIDSTPLFLMLAAAHLRRSGDLELANELWPAYERALDWVLRQTDRYGGYLAYARRTERGLVNQGWKDSHDSISHRDGRLAEPPVALVEVQGYAYAAYRGLAFVAARLGRPALARDLRARAADLAARFQRDFWMERDGFYALALDGDQKACEVVASNAGQCLYTGIVPAAVAPRVVARLMAPDVFCGWGIRTLSARERRYNPMSYHNGSVWPHDNALIAAGLRRYGATSEALRVLDAFFNASLHAERARLPELFCGFARAEHSAPVPYPVACRPQAFAAGAAFLMLQAALGMTFDARRQRIVLDRPCLPEWVREVRLENVRVGAACVDLCITRHRGGASVEVLRRSGAMDLIVRK